MGRFLENHTIFSGEFVLSSLEWIGDFFSEIFIIIDGVDECLNREEFCESLGRLVERTNMSVLVVSRPEHDIATADVFLGKSTLNIDDAVKLDISTHVSWYMEKDKKLRRYRPELKAELLVTLTTKCDGMCLAFQINTNVVGSNGSNANLNTFEPFEHNSTFGKLLVACHPGYLQPTKACSIELVAYHEICDMHKRRSCGLYIVRDS